MNPDPAIFATDLQDPNKKLIFKKVSAYYFLKVYLHHFSKIKSPKKSQNSGNQGFSYYLCLMLEESGSRSGAGSRSKSLISGSGWPKKHVDPDPDSDPEHC